MPKRLSLIIPTIGRSTLHRAVESAFSQMALGDEVIVVSDGVDISEERLPWLSGVCYLRLPTPTGDFGCTPCDEGIKIARGDAVFFLGDDDICAPGAFDAIRAAVEAAPDVPHLFSMTHTGRQLGGTLDCCAVSGQQIVVPRDLTKMPRMAEHTPGERAVSDWVFIIKVHLAWNQQTVFHPEIISILPHMNQGRME